MPFKSISRHQPSQREPWLSWPSLTGKYLKNCWYHQNKMPQRSLFTQAAASSNPKQQQIEGKCCRLPSHIPKQLSGARFSNSDRSHWARCTPHRPNALYGPANSWHRTHPHRERDDTEDMQATRHLWNMRARKNQKYNISNDNQSSAEIIGRKTIAARMESLQQTDWTV